MPGVVCSARLAGRQFGAIMFASCSLRFPTQISWLRITQFTLLRALARAGGPMTQDALGELLAVDSTTLSRTLRQLERSKWIRRVAGPDVRERRVDLSAQGRRVLERATPAWERVQRRLRPELGTRDWAALEEVLDVGGDSVRGA